MGYNTDGAMAPNEDPNVNISFADARAEGSGAVHQVGYQQNNYFQAPFKDQKRILLDEFGPTDPKEERCRIIDQKDELLEGSCDWVLAEESFQAWHQSKTSANILWIHGDAGKGKTMMMEAILNHVEEEVKTNNGSKAFAYFFCQRTDDRLNTATAILKGLLYMLVKQSETIAKYLIQTYHIRENDSEKEMSFWKLWSAFKELLDASVETEIFIFIDALDECSTEMLVFLDRITQLKGHVHWLLTSRNEPGFTEKLSNIAVANQISLEANSTHVTKAVKHFIKVKVKLLAELKEYKEAQAKRVEEYLEVNAQDTFLWVALAFQELQKVSRMNTEKKLKEFPPKLAPLYKQMLLQIEKGEDAERVDLCLTLLRTVIVCYRPQTLTSLGHICNLPIEYLEDSDDTKDISDLIAHCGSFLVERNSRVYLVHQSATDFLSGPQGVFPKDICETHGRVTVSLFRILETNLKKDICNVGKPGVLLEDVPNLDDLVASQIPTQLQYACMYWIKHLIQAGIPHFPRLGFYDEGPAHKLLQNSVLNWLECLCWLKNVPDGLLDLERLTHEMKMNSCQKLRFFLEDANRLLVVFRRSIEDAPLQLYSFAPIFSPQESILRTAIGCPRWLVGAPEVDQAWERAWRVLEGHARTIERLSFSPNGKFLASTCDARNLRAWDTQTGNFLGSFQGFERDITHLTFSEDSKIIVAVSEHEIIRTSNLTDAKFTGEVIQRFDRVVPASASLSADASTAAFGFPDNTIVIWDVCSNQLRRNLRDPGYAFGIDPRVLLSPNGEKIAYHHEKKYKDPLNRVRIRSTVNVEEELLLPNASLLRKSKFSENCGFCPGGKLILLESGDNKALSLRDTSSGASIDVLPKESGPLLEFAFGPNGDSLTLVYITEHDDLVAFRTDCYSGVAKRHILRLTSGQESTSAISRNGEVLAYGERLEIDIWSIRNNEVVHRTKVNITERMMCTALQPGGSLLAGGCGPTLKLLDLSRNTSQDVRLVTGTKTEHIAYFTLCPVHKLLASLYTHERFIYVWGFVETSTLSLRGKIPYLSDRYAVAFDFVPGRAILAVVASDGWTSFIDAIHCKPLGTLESRLRISHRIKFSPDGKYLATRYNTLNTSSIELWEIDTKKRVFCSTLGAEEAIVRIENTPPINLDTFLDLGYPAMDSSGNLSLDDGYQWITWKGERLLRLPHSLRPSRRYEVGIIGNAVFLHVNHRLRMLAFDTKCLERGEFLETRKHPPSIMSTPREGTEDTEEPPISYEESNALELHKKRRNRANLFEEPTSNTEHATSSNKRLEPQSARPLSAEDAAMLRRGLKKLLGK